MDFDAKQDYAQYSIKVDMVSGAILGNKIFGRNELRMHEAEFDNNLYSPLRRNRDKFSYMTSEGLSVEKIDLANYKKKTEDLIQIELVT